MTAIAREAWVVVVPATRQSENLSAELIGEATRLVGSDPVRALVVGRGVGAVADDLAKWGIASTLTVDHPLLDGYHPEIFARVVAAAVRDRQPQAVLFAGTVLCSDLGGRAAQLLGCRFHAGVVNAELSGGSLTVTRPVWGGRRHQNESSERGPFLFSLVPDTVGPGAPSAPTARTVPSEPLAVAIDDGNVTLTNLGFTPADPRTMDIADADLIVSGGRGVGGPEGFELITQVADQLGGSVGASRPAVEAGWAPYERQVGQTGRVVRPKVYIACGISGASQHLAGMRESTTIVTINNDPSAPIHNLAHLAVEGDLHDVLGALLQRLRSRREGAA